MSSEKDLPQDVVIEILSRLPVKTLLRFRCVCKSWYATITHPSFITTHLNLNRTSSYNNHGYLQYSNFDPSKKSKWFVFSDQSYFNHVGFETPFNCRPSYHLKLVGSVNGILCLVDERSYCNGRTVYLWNPSIRKSKTLPSASTIHHLSDHENQFAFGFGFDRQSNDYKVVRILYHTYTHGNYNAQLPPQVEVYTLSTDSWRKIDAVVPCYMDYHPGSIQFDAFINGSVHLFASKSVKAWRDMIMSFDFGEELFGEMKLPEYYYLDGVKPLFLWLTLFEESLSLIDCHSYTRINSCCLIWVMREYGVVESWTKQFTVVVSDFIIGSLCFTRNNELLLQSAKGEMISCDLKSSQHKFHRTRWRDASDVVPFVETLVFLDLENAENSQVEQENSFYGNRNLRLVRKFQQVGILFIFFLLSFIIYLLTVWVSYAF